MRPELIAEQVLAALTAAGQSLVTAESLTGGLIGARLTAVPGASRAYLGGLITYATQAKSGLAGVSPELLKEYGAVSPQSAVAMAEGVQRLIGADWAVAVTGVAGPDPQEGHQPGEVWIGLVGPKLAPTAIRGDFRGDREQIREATVDAALGAVFSAIDSETPSTNG